MAIWALGYVGTHMLAILCSPKNLLSPYRQSKAVCSTMLYHGCVPGAYFVEMVYSR